MTPSDRRTLAIGACAVVVGAFCGSMARDYLHGPPKPEVRYLTRTVEVPTVRYWPSEPKVVTVYKEREPIPQPTECLVMRWVD